MIEAMACGTRTIAFPKGSVLEVIDEGISGLLVGDIAEAVIAANKFTNLIACKPAGASSGGLRLNGSRASIWISIALRREFRISRAAR